MKAYGVFIPSKKKPISTFNCLRSAEVYAKKGFSRCIFDLDTGIEVTAGTIPRQLREFIK